tara:strand:+ start:285 stop:476 length:192 start_codon:yes stop_codon:yes gene_type:complete
LLVVKSHPKLTDEIVTVNYEEIIKNGVPFLQVFPQMLQGVSFWSIDLKINPYERKQDQYIIMA